jgi:hypothetical protein
MYSGRSDADLSRGHQWFCRGIGSMIFPSATIAEGSPKSFANIKCLLGFFFIQYFQLRRGVDLAGG